MPSVARPLSAFRTMLSPPRAPSRWLPIAADLAGVIAAVALGGCSSGYRKAAAPYEVAAPPVMAVASAESAGGEVYAPRADNPQIETAIAPVSTFSIDVDTASYANVRRMLRSGQLPPADAVRAEELINAFTYRYQLPASAGAPIAISTELATSPFHPGRRLARIGLATAPLSDERTPPRNLVFLVDTSGSMASADKLPLLVSGLRLLTASLRPVDRVAIVAYAGSAGAVLPPTPGDRKAEILEALGHLSSGGSTNGGEGIELAYRLATESFHEDGINRVILCTDGDFNVGASSQQALVELITAKRQTGVYLTVMGLGTGNLKDATMESLAQHGNGNYGYVDTLDEARKRLVEEAGGTLLTVARDVKVQVAFDERRVASYRLIGYENRLLSEQDFADDRKDAGEIGAGHRVTALYELTLTDAGAAPDAQASLFTVKVRAKHERGGAPFELAAQGTDAPRPFSQASPDLRLASALAGFAMLLRGTASAAGRGDVDYRWARDTARATTVAAPSAAAAAERAELVELIQTAARLAGAPLDDATPVSIAQ
jgi:Ca-activated chloride channel homolog